MWERLLSVLLDRLGSDEQIEWERASLDSAIIQAKRGAKKTGANPTEDKGKSGTKRHLVLDRRGIPLSAVMLTAANVRDSMVFEELLDSIGPIKRPGRGRPRKRPEKLQAYPKPTMTRNVHVR